LGAGEWRINLYHTKLYNLFNAVDRTEFIKEFVALLRFVAAGEANIGHVRKNSTIIHRSVTDPEGIEDETEMGPPQEVLTTVEKKSWRILNAHQYTL